MASELGGTEHESVRSLFEERRPLKLATVSLIVLTCLLSVVVLSWSVLHTKSLELKNASISASNTALTLANQASSSFKVADTVLVALVDKVEVEGWSALSIDRLRALMMKQMADLPSLQGLFIYDAQGRWIVNSAGKQFDGRNNADRAYFQYHQRHPGRSVHVGAPIIGRTSGAWIIPVSRRIDHPDGSFAGVALATIKIDFFRKIYERLDLGEASRIFVTLDGNTLLLQIPFLASAIGAQQIPALVSHTHGAATSTTNIELDGVRYIVSRARAGEYPVDITLLRPERLVLRPWLESAGLAYLALVSLITGLVFLGRRVVRQLSLRDHLERTLLTTTLALETANNGLSTMAYIDGLTDLFNRRYYEQAFEQEFQRALRDHTSLAVLMIDVDNFKKFNDRYGHLSGDEGLRMVARSIIRGLRNKGEFAARYGGEEFIVVLPNTDLHTAHDVAEAIRAEVLRCEVEHLDSPTTFLTVSIGVAAVCPGTCDSKSNLVAAADAALYRAKSAGRNRVSA
ncbi:diguanylate cyclase [Massilia sp. TN1-12]|uniref:diguanylate cyclase n=1 Tax=Massilia paldalensis TaxID=3377675 RepID=UPI00384E2160